MSYASDRILNRQRICQKCKSFVTHEKSNDKLACPLCGNRMALAPAPEPPIPSRVVARLVAEQHAAARRKRRSIDS